MLARKMKAAVVVQPNINTRFIAFFQKNFAEPAPYFNEARDDVMAVAFGIIWGPIKVLP